MSESHAHPASSVVTVPPVVQGAVAAGPSFDRPPATIPDRLNPWLALWAHPKRTMRWILEHRTPVRSMPILLIASLFATVQSIADLNWGDKLSPGALLATGVALTLLFFVALYYPFGWLLHRMGVALRGRATLTQTRVMFCWSAIFTILGYGLPLAGGLFTFGRAYFSSAKLDMIEADPTRATAYSATIVISNLIMIAGVVYSLAMFAETHRFAWWRALVANIYAGLITGVLLLLALIVVAIVR